MDVRAVVTVRGRCGVSSFLRRSHGSGVRNAGDSVTWDGAATRVLLVLKASFLLLEHYVRPHPSRLVMPCRTPRAPPSVLVDGRGVKCRSSVRFV